MGRESTEDRKKAIAETLDAAEVLLNNGSLNAAMNLMAQAIEVTGGLSDRKPAAAKDQGKKRFLAACRKSLGKGYALNAEKLYDQLRCKYIHSLLPGNYIAFTDNAAEHLKEKEKVLLLNGECLLKDLRKLISD